MSIEPRCLRCFGDFSKDDPNRPCNEVCQRCQDEAMIHEFWDSITRQMAETLDKEIMKGN
jgi:hypothetical protein